MNLTLRFIVRGLALVAGVAGASSVLAATLTLEKTIPLPGVEGRIDHFAYDVAGRRLFIAALGNNSVEVVDLPAGRVVHSIRGLAEPQGIFYVATTDRLYVANGGDGAVQVFDGRSYASITRIKFADDADNLRYDEARKRLYVGYGGGGLGVIDVTTNQVAGDIPLKAHPESFQLEKNGPRAFVNVPNAHQVAIVDRERKTTLGTWSLGLVAANFPMALDEARHRAFIACRVPARLVVFDTETGKEVAKVDLHGDCDDLFFDDARRRLYASCGEGFIDVFSAVDGDHYALREAVKTEARARTAFFDGDRFYLAVPKRGERPAEVRSYRIQD